MAELQQITGHIEQAAKEKAAQIMADAKAQYEETMRTYQARGEEEKKEIIEEARKEGERITSRAISAAAQKNAQDILSLKMRLIEEVIQQAKQSILTMDKDAYMARLEKLLDSKMQEPYPKGVICFNETDAKALSKGLKSKISKYNLEISKEFADISGGFLLVFGNIEENCSVDALFREYNEKLIDFVGANLF